MAMDMQASGQSIKAEGDIRLGANPAGTTKPWIKIDPKGDDALSKSLSGSLTEMKQNSDPSQLLKRIEGAGDITATAQESLNGKQTTHYSDWGKAVTVNAPPADQVGSLGGR